MKNNDQRRHLRELIRYAFSETQIQEIAFDLGIDQDDLRKLNKSEKIIFIIDVCSREGRVEQLLDNCRDLRPNEDWPENFDLRAKTNTAKELISYKAHILLPQLDFVNIPAGKFLMGTNLEVDPAASEWETPKHEVYLSTFKISRTPITNQQYQCFIKDTAYPAPSHWEDGEVPQGFVHYPVVNVSWKDSVAFCRWYGRQIQKECRLPTEAEWEKVARGIQGQRYPWGDQWNTSKLNCRENNLRRPTPVGDFYKDGDNIYGVVDMMGNVWGWCSDYFDSDIYRRRSHIMVSNPSGPTTGNRRVVRGSTFSMNRTSSRATARWSFPELTENLMLGFRCVQEIQTEN